MSASFSFSQISPDPRFSTPEGGVICRQKLEDYILRSQRQAAHVIARILAETPRDRFVPAQAMRFSPDLRLELPEGKTGLHQHALDQAAERAGLKLGFLHDLSARGAWGQELVAHNLNTLLGHAEANSRFLVREAGGQIRAVLSDSYRRIDSRPTLDALIQAADEFGAVIADGVHADTRVSLKIIKNTPVEVFPGEWMCFGLDYSNSDYGDGAHEISAFLLRLWCLNGAVSAKQVRKVHIGRRYVEGYSEETMRRDAATLASATRDEVRALLAPAATERLIETVRRANGAQITADEVDEFTKPRLTKTESDQVAMKFASADIVELPPGQTPWRLSNAISWLAKHTESPRRRLELERAAGEAL